MTTPNKIFIAADHAGFELKRFLTKNLVAKGYEVVDKGADTYDENDSYPTYMAEVAKEVLKDIAANGENSAARGVIMGGSGTGEALVANRFKGIRAAVYYGGNKEIVRLARDHNDANVISLGARFMTSEDALEAVLLFLTTPFSGKERHARRNVDVDRVS